MKGRFLSLGTYHDKIHRELDQMSKKKKSVDIDLEIYKSKTQSEKYANYQFFLKLPGKEKISLKKDQLIQITRN